MKKPVIWIPAIITSLILGPLATTVFQMKNIAAGAGMGTSRISWTNSDMADND